MPAPRGTVKTSKPLEQCISVDELMRWYDIVLDCERVKISAATLANGDDKEALRQAVRQLSMSMDNLRRRMTDVLHPED